MQHSHQNGKADHGTSNDDDGPDEGVHFALCDGVAQGDVCCAKHSGVNETNLSVRQHSSHLTPAAKQLSV